MRGVGLIILAAGNSSRLGTPKQLLSFRGKSLLRHAIETGLASVCRPVAVVLGAYADELKLEAEGLPVTVVRNPNWRTGMNTSIRAGVEAIADGFARGEEQPAGAVMIMLCDQPLVSPSLLNLMVSIHESEECGMVASEYEGTPGVPALFGRAYYSELMSLPPGEGAKRVLLNHRKTVRRVAFPQGTLDIDTPEDYRRLSVQR